jgi:hypothetical protein
LPDAASSIIDYLRLRRRGYQLAFNNNNVVVGLRKAYLVAFGNYAGQSVLFDLARYCRAQESCVVPGDHDRTLLLEGRREVWLRITDHLRLQPEQLYALYASQNFNEEKKELDDAG